MTKEVKSAQLERVKKTAYSVKERAEGLGHKLPLTHIYELVATASGFRNWATMKAKFQSSAVSFHIGNVHEWSAISVGEDINRKILVSPDELSKHIELVGDIGFREKASMTFVRSAIEKGNPVVILLNGDDMALKTKIEKIANDVGLSDQCISLDFSRLDSPSFAVDMDGRGSDELGVDIASLSYDYGTEHRGDSYLWKLRQQNVASVAVDVALDEAQREANKSAISFDKLQEYLDFNKMLKRMYSPATPERIQKKLRGMLSTLPGFKEGLVQTQTTQDQYGYSEMILTRTLASLGLKGVTLGGSKGAMSMRELLRAERVTMITLPEGEKSMSHETYIGKFLISEFVSALGSFNGKRKPICIIPDIEGFVPAFLDDLLFKATELGGSFVIGSGDHLDSPALKSSTTLKEKGDLVLMYDGKSRRYINLKK